MNRKFQVFVSSTYLDMKEERQAAVEAILDAGHIPAGMELFGAGDQSQWETIKHWIDDSDVYMLILGGRYGSIEPASGKSYIEIEYRYAEAQGKPLFALVIDEGYLDAKLKSVGRAVIEQDNGALLKVFRAHVGAKICRFFKDLNELKTGVMKSLRDFERRGGLVGWVRGDQVVDAKATLEEVERLRRENVDLQNKLSDLTQNHFAFASPSHSRLSDEEQRILLAAASTSDGIIGRLIDSEGFSLQAGGTALVQTIDGREEAIWQAALENLEDLSLIRAIGTRGQMFKLTHAGYEAADKARAAKAGRTVDERSSPNDQAV